MSTKLEKFVQKREFISIIVILGVAIINILRLFIMIYRGVPHMGDHVWIWTECRIAWYGVSPYEALRNNLVINGLQTFPHVSTLPWGLTLSTIIHGAFLPLEYSKIWYAAINFLIFAVMLACVNKKVFSYRYSQSQIIAVNILLVSSWYYLDGILPLNNGMLICFLIIIAICIIDRFEYLAGIVMIFTMIKPQNAIPFFVVFLLLGKWKTIATSVIGVLVSWGISSLWTKESPIDQLYGVISFASNPEESYHMVGIFDFIRKYDVSSMLALILSMIAGVVIILIVMTIWKNKNKMNNLTTWLIYSIPAIVSIMWCYKSYADYLILLIPAIALFELIISTDNDMDWLVYIIFTVVLLTKPFSTALLGRLPFMTEYMCNRLDLYVKTLSIIPIVYGANKFQNSVKVFGKSPKS